MSSQALKTIFGSSIARTLRVVERADEFAARHARNIAASPPIDEGAASGAGSPKVTGWTQTSGGVVFEHELITYQNSGESESAWQARHDAAVTAAQAQFPPDA